MTGFTLFAIPCWDCRNVFTMTALDTASPLGTRIRHARLLADATQQQLADASHLSRTTVVAIEAGAKSPHRSTLLAIFTGLRHLGIDLATLNGEAA
jgi:transcriptional regulator with XRE-family HTH domain